MRKIMLSLFILVLLVGTISALEIDNWKTYDDNKREYTITNLFGQGDEIAKVTLNTPLNFLVPIGYQRVAEFSVENYDDYVNVFNYMEFYNTKKSNELFVRDFDYKYKTIIQVPNFKYNCPIDDGDNKTIETCIKFQDGTKDKITWTEINKANGLLKGNITIGIFTDVKIGDKVEWIPTLFGERLDQWSVWTASLNVDLIAYWTLDDVYTDSSIFSNTLSPINSPTFNTGIINNGSDFESGSTQYSTRVAGDLYPTLPFSINLWVKPESVVSDSVFVNKRSDAAGRLRYNILRFSTTDKVAFNAHNAGSTSIQITSDAGALTNGEWTMITAVLDGTDMRLYINGSLSGTPAAITDLLDTAEQPFYMGSNAGTGQFYDGIIDEVSIWNRSLSPAEVTQLYNNGLAIQVTFNFVPVVTLNSPVNEFNTTNSTIDFNATISNTIVLANVSLFIDGVLNETNSSGINSTNYLFTKNIADGSHNWTYEACDNVGCGIGTTRNFTIDTAPRINVNSPTNITFTAPTIFFNATTNKSIDTWIVNYNGTNVTLSDVNTTLEVEDGFHHLLLYANNSDTGSFGLNDTIFFSVDSNVPSLNVTQPFGVINFQDISINQTLLWNVSDINIDTCLFQYEGANTTLNCATNVSNFTIGDARTLTFFANDSFGNMASQVVTWSYLVLQTSTTFNSSSFETGTERFTINVTTNGSSITAGTLTFNGIENTGATITNPIGNNFSITKSIIIPTSIGTKNHNFNLTISGKIINTTLQTQIINATNFTLCGSAPLNVPYINITFKNETLAEEDITAIISSTWSYSLSTLSTINKTLIFTNATENVNYVFCSNPSDRALNIVLNMDYDNSISQQRSFSLTTQLTSIISTQVLYLLPTVLGIFSPFKTTNINGDTIAFVSATITRVLSGSTITVGSGLTDSSGFATFFLNPNAAHTATFSKTGFADNVFVFTPSTDLRTVVMGGGGIISNGTIVTRGTTYFIDPKASTLANNTDFTFTFNVTSNLTTITLISMNITNISNYELLFVSNAGVGNLSGVLNTGNNSQLFGFYTIKTAEETITITRTWAIFTTFVGDYSIFRQLTLAKDNVLISDFNRLLIVLAVMFGIVIFMSVGQILETSESKISVLLLLVWAFSIVGWLDTGLAVTTTNTGINRLGEFSNQFGIAILMTGAAIIFIFRRLFIRTPR
ncbi:hypothetical protein LCGC14_0538350 [marine sediment metagenome]|uniref:LamG-like jellyroll fold domain-containing protein n=1 Tax=marine sediment metagenome TaxID=412755 RepID=A0A0F9SC45_9ZZZZ|nr:LamG domain-containing protein [bacterium]